MTGVELIAFLSMCATVVFGTMFLWLWWSERARRMLLDGLRADGPLRELGRGALDKPISFVVTRPKLHETSTTRDVQVDAVMRGQEEVWELRTTLASADVVVPASFHIVDEGWLPVTRAAREIACVTRVTPRLGVHAAAEDVVAPWLSRVREDLCTALLVPDGAISVQVTRVGDDVNVLLELHRDDMSLPQLREALARLDDVIELLAGRALSPARRARSTPGLPTTPAPLPAPAT